MRSFSDLARDTTGATAIEYGLIITFLAVGFLAAMQGLKNEIVYDFGVVSTTLDDAF